MEINAKNNAESFNDFQKKTDEKIYQIDENAFIDGIINYDKYSKSPTKILWILKEPNSTEGKLNWREEIRLIPTYNGNLGAFEKTFANIVYTSYGLLNKKKWNEMQWIKDDPSIVNSLEEIAFINISKTPGGSKSNDAFLELQYQSYYKDVVKNQIINFRPNIIIGGNTIKFIIEDLKEIYPSLQYEKHVQSSNLGIHISEEDNLLVFDARHPQNTSSSREIYCNDIIDNYLSLNSKKLKMKTIEFEKFRKDWINRLDKMFWHKFHEKQEHLTMFYMFDFCSLSSDVRVDEFGHIFLCYNYEKTNDSENNVLLKNIIERLFGENKNDKYIAYYKLKSDDDYREVLMALFLIGNEIKDSELQNYLLKNNVRKHIEKFQKTDLDSDELLEKYIDEIISELKAVALRTKNVIFENENLLNNAKKFWNLPFIKHCEE